MRYFQLYFNLEKRYTHVVDNKYKCVNSSKVLKKTLGTKVTSRFAHSACQHVAWALAQIAFFTRAGPISIIIVTEIQNGSYSFHISYATQQEDPEDRSADESEQPGL